jgi:hypothetical protein
MPSMVVYFAYAHQLASEDHAAQAAALANLRHHGLHLLIAAFMIKGSNSNPSFLLYTLLNRVGLILETCS